jgi:cyclohexyl-isocyanide hydratase
MDVAGPYEFFSWWKGAVKGVTNVTLTLAAETCDPVKSRDNFVLTPNQTFDYYKENNLQANMIWTPGGNPDNLHVLMQPGTAYLNFLNQQAEHADWVCSVCEGALLLAAAGLLDGYTATTHWYFIPCLAKFEEITIADGYPRFYRDRNRMTGGGISSGLDESLELIKIIAGKDMAENVQLNTQYYPQPPVSSTIPGSTTCSVNMTGVDLG